MGNIFDDLVTLKAACKKSIKILMGDIGAGKTTALQDMPKTAGGTILYIPVGNDTGFSQVQNVMYEGKPGFVTFPKSIQTKWITRETVKNGVLDVKIIGIKEKIAPQLIEILQNYLHDPRDMRGLTIDAISSIQGIMENEFKFEKSGNLDWDAWAEISQNMLQIYELCEEIAQQDHEVAVQSHFQVREHNDSYSGEEMSRVLPMMTEKNATRVLKNADIVAFYRVGSDSKDKKIPKRYCVLGGHPIIPTKIRNVNNLSFDGILLENVSYGDLVALMEIESLDEIKDLDGVKVKYEDKKKDSRKKGNKKKTKSTDVEEDDDVEEETVVEKKTKPRKKKATPKVDVEVEEIEEDEEPVKKVVRKKKKTAVKPVEEEVIEEDDEDTEPEVVTPVRKKKKKRPPVVVEEVEEEEDDEEEVEVVKVVKKKRKPVRKVVEVEEDDEEEDDEPVRPVKKKKKKAVVEDDEDDEDALFDDDLFEEEQ